MRNNAVVVADDDPARARKLAMWLRACGIPAYTPATDGRDTTTLAMIHELQPRIVVCRPGTTGIALFHPLRAMSEPPMVILLQENRSARDEVHHIEDLIVASVRTPVPMPGLCNFIRTALAIVARLDAAPVAGADSAANAPSVGQVVTAATRAMRSLVQDAR